MKVLILAVVLPSVMKHGGEKNVIISFRTINTTIAQVSRLLPQQSKQASPLGGATETLKIYLKVKPLFFCSSTHT